MQGHDKLVEYSRFQKDKRDLDSDNRNFFKVGTRDSGEPTDDAGEVDKHNKELDKLFVEKKREIEQLEEKPEKFKSHQLPLARIKKIMKSDEDVKMISAEAPILFAKACELFIMDLSFRALYHTNHNKRKTLQKTDIAKTVTENEMYDFLIDIIPRDETGSDYLQKREPDQASLMTTQMKQKFVYQTRDPSANTYMKNPLYSVQTGPQLKAIGGISGRYAESQMGDPSEIDPNFDRQSEANWSVMGNKNKGSRPFV